MALSTCNAVFGHFQNLNLLFLLQDLRDGRTTRQSWLSGSLLCPVAHGISHGTQVRELRALGQVEELAVGCDYAARDLGANPDDVLRFVRLWDAQFLSDEALIQQLEAIWHERLADAEAFQQLLQVDNNAPLGEASQAESIATSGDSVASTQMCARAALA